MSLITYRLNNYCNVQSNFEMFSLCFYEGTFGHYSFNFINNRIFLRSKDNMGFPIIMSYPDSNILLLNNFEIPYSFPNPLYFLNRF